MTSAEFQEAGTLGEAQSARLPGTTELALVPGTTVVAAIVGASGRIDVTERDLVVLKSSQHFRAAFTELATDIITADSRGLTTLRVENFDHVRADGPRWPIDADAQWRRSTIE